MSSSLIELIRQDLQASVDDKTKASFQRFFKEKVTCYGVKTATVGKIAKKHWNQAKLLSKPALFAVCEELFRSGVTEEAFVVSFWLPNYIDHLNKGDLVTFKQWIEQYVDNWAKCDGFCNHTVGNFMETYPESVAELKVWAKSENRWLKRASAVSLIVPAKKGRFLQDAFEISDMLLVDKDDLVQKGYGWLLKEESRKHQKDVYEYVLRNRPVMPRTALRYAIELMPKELKTEAIKKN
ncbi:MAG: DNA alkylation repair protein [Candidatus Bathyarchaeota archaeon]|nr:DNA alkylation repair protein [Candidatus Bathyarchaeota archaeon]